MTSEPERVNRPGDQPRYRVGRRCPWNVYRINPDNEDRDHDDRFAVAIGPGAPVDGALIAEALNGWQSMDSDLRWMLAEARAQVAAQVAEIERLRDKAANAVADQAMLKGLSVEAGAAVLELAPPRELVIAFVDAARKMLGDAENYSETRVDFPAVSMEIKAAGEFERYVFTVQRAGKLTPHGARKQAEAERDEAQEAAARLSREVAELTRDLEDEVAERERAEDWADRIAAAFVPADILGEHGSSNSPWANALEWAESGRPVAQEAGEPPTECVDGRPTDADDYGQDYEGQAHALGLPEPDDVVPRRPRVWQKGELQPPAGTRVRDRHGDVWTRYTERPLWKGRPDSVGYEWSAVLMYGPLTELLPEVPSGGTE